MSAFCVACRKLSHASVLPADDQLVAGDNELGDGVERPCHGRGIVSLSDIDAVDLDLGFGPAPSR